MRRFVRIGATILMLSAMLCAQSRGRKIEDAAGPRDLTGTVSDRDNHAVPSAVVYLKNARNLAIYTYIASDDGSYRFNNLSPDVDYKIYAEFSGHKSEVKTLSSFDTHKQAHINLRLGK